MPVRDRMTGSVTGIVGSPDDNEDPNRVMTVQEVGERLRKRHPKHLQLLTNYKLEKLLTLIQGHQRGLSQEAVLVRWDMEHTVDGQEDLNKLDNDSLRKKKLAMEETFEKHRILPGDPNYIYDKEVNFDEGDKLDCDWDLDSDSEQHKQPKPGGQATTKNTIASPSEQFGLASSAVSPTKLLTTSLDNDPISTSDEKVNIPALQTFQVSTAATHSNDLLVDDIDDFFDD
ncbi:uncharacterized protein LOC142337562 isoform X2 [Convolutriloba macropyga]